MSLVWRWQTRSWGRGFLVLVPPGEVFCYQPLWEIVRILPMDSRQNLLVGRQALSRELVMQVETEETPQFSKQLA